MDLKNTMGWDWIRIMKERTLAVSEEHELDVCESYQKGIAADW